MSWIPPKSPFDLLQERYWPDDWKILIVCLLLNQTSRKQVEPMIESFFEKWPDPESALNADEDEMRDLVRPLGMFNRRVKSIKKMSHQFMSGFDNAIELYGCGKYADDAYRIFMKGEWLDVEPNDHALNDYHGHLKCLYNVS
jgi:methyl-CpG-binding domain protein 4